MERTTAASHFAARRGYLVAAMALIGFSLYTSLLPFDLRLVSLETAWTEFGASVLTIGTGDVSRTDVLANLLLFIPIGFSLAGYFLVERRSRLALFAAPFFVLFASLMTSLAAEFIQVFAFGRVPSGEDVASQTLGCAIGLALWALVGGAFTQWIRETRFVTGAGRIERLLYGLVAIWLFANLAPFDVTVDVGDLVARWRAGDINLVPFSGPSLPLQERVLDAFIKVVIAIPIGMAARRWFYSRGHRSRMLALTGGIALVTSVELAQITVTSHSADATDVVLGGLGVAVGVLVIGYAWQDRYSAAEDETGLVSWRGVAAWIVCGVVVVIYHWLPFDFVFDPDAVRAKLDGMSLIPFAVYISGPSLNALNDLMTTSALAAPWGLSAAFTSRRPPRNSRIVAMVWTVGAAGLLAAIEAGQLFLPTRTPDPTDVLVGSVAFLGGLIVGMWLQAGRRESARLS